MKKWCYRLMALPLFAILLELLPTGAVLIFANPEGDPFRRTYSYFDPITYGYANFGPFPVAILTVLLLVLAAAFAIRPRRGLCSWILGVAGAAFLLSLTPLLYGWNYFTPAASCISAVLLLMTACAAAVRFGKEGYGI